MPDQNFIDKLAKLLGLKNDAIKEKIADLDVDQILELVDAANHDHIDDARAILQVTSQTQDEGSEEKDAIDDTTDGDDVEADAPKGKPLNPLFSRDPTPGTSKDADEEDVEEGADETYHPGIGDKVRVGKHRGVVKNPHGPGDTVGVLIDGEYTMVNKNGLRRDRTDEGVLGMTPMIDLNRMRALAGLPTSTAPLSPGAVGMAAPTDEEEEPCEVSDATQGNVVGQVSYVTQADLLGDTAPAVAGSTSPHHPESPCMDIGGILQSFDEIEAGLPELRVRDARVVRERINTLLQRLNENIVPRRLKPGTRLVNEDAVPPPGKPRDFYADGYRVGSTWNEEWRHIPRGPQASGFENCQLWKQGWFEGRRDSLRKRIADLEAKHAAENAARNAH